MADRLAWLLLGLCLVGCAGEQAGPCRLTPVADLPATLDHNRLEVTGRVNGAETKLVLDTGAQQTVLSSATVDMLRLPRSQHSSTRLTGIGGVISNADAFADVRLGSVDVQRRFAVADLPGLGGLVGADVLGSYDVEFDLPGHRVRLWRAPGCGAADVPWTGPRSTVAVGVTGGGLIVIPVTVDGAPVRALLDSGAAISLLTAEAAERAGVPRSALAIDGLVPVRGVDGAPINLRLHRFQRFDVAGETRRAVRLGVGEFRLADNDMLLGIDYLKSRRVWIAYRVEQMFVQAAAAP